MGAQAPAQGRPRRRERASAAWPPWRHLLGQVIDADPHRSAQHRGTFDRVLELSNVAGPPVGTECVHGIWREAAEVATEAFLEPAKEMIRQQRHVSATFSQRRKVERDDVDAVVQVLAESTRLHQLRQISVARQNEADVRPHRLVAAQWLVHPLLQNAKQFHLHRQRGGVDLIKEQRPALCRGNAAGAVAVGPGERPLHVPEQLALQQGGGEGGAVDGDHRPVPPRAVDVQHPGDQLLAGAALPADQHGRVAGGDLSGRRQRPFDGGAVTTQPAAVEIARL